MNNSDTLSVDPGRTTLGALHPELNAQFLRGTVRVPRRKKSGKKTLNFFFAATALCANSKGLAMLLLRWALGALLIVSGSFILSGEIDSPVSYINPELYAILEIVSGGMLALGLFTRVAMGIATLGFATISTLSIIEGIFNLEALMCCVSCMVFLIFGSGKFSCDFLIRKAIILATSKRKRRLQKNKMTYKAFRYASHG